MQQQMNNAIKVADFLKDHPMVEKVYYLGLLQEGSKDHEIYEKQYTSPGAMISFDIAGGEKEAFAFLNSLKLFKLAVSLGSTESLVQHPSTMTHAGVSPEDKKYLNITDKLIRLSIGVEDADDLIWDIGQAFESLKEKNGVQKTEALV